MFAALRKFFERPAPMPPPAFVAAWRKSLRKPFDPATEFCKFCDTPPLKPTPSGMRWCLGLDDQWTLVKIDPLPRKRKAKAKSKAKRRH